MGELIHPAMVSPQKFERVCQKKTAPWLDQDADEVIQF